MQQNIFTKNPIKLVISLITTLIRESPEFFTLFDLIVQNFVRSFGNPYKEFCRIIFKKIHFNTREEGMMVRTDLQSIKINYTIIENNFQMYCFANNFSYREFSKDKSDYLGNIIGYEVRDDIQEYVLRNIRLINKNYSVDKKLASMEETFFECFKFTNYNDDEISLDQMFEHYKNFCQINYNVEANYANSDLFLAKLQLLTETYKFFIAK